MEILGIFLLPLLIAAGVYIYSLFCKFKAHKLSKQISNFITYCKNNNWIQCETMPERIVFRRAVSEDALKEIYDLTGVKIQIPKRCHLYEYYFVTNTPEWEERCEFIVKHHGGLQLNHNFVIEIDGLHQPFNSTFRSINQIAKGDEFDEWNYNYFLLEDKKSAYRELAEKIYPKRMDDYNKFMKHLGFKQ